MSDSIPFIQLFSENKNQLSGAIFTEFRRVFESSQFILGDSVGKFETRFADLCGVRYAVGVNSGLDALMLSLRALGIGPGDEVITPPNSFLGSTSAIALAGARPVFVDVGLDYNLDVELIEKAITKRTKAILPVHLTGNPCDMRRITEIALKHGLKIIEDAAQAVSARFEKKCVGAFGDTGCFSLHPLKNLHVWGDGGIIVTNDEELANNLKLQRNHGLVNRDEAEFFSFNSRLDTLQAVVGLAFLELLKETTEKRRMFAAIYDARLSGIGDLRLPQVDRVRAEPVYHVYQIATSQRDSLKKHLEAKGIGTKIHYPIPIHLQKASAYLGYKRGDFPVTERLAAEILSIPIRENLTEDQIHYICDCIEGFFKR